MIRYVIAWIPMVFIAIANGALRQLTFGKVMPELLAHQISTAIGSILIGLYIYLVIRIWLPSSSKQAIVIGIIWLLLTVIFEFSMGRFILKRSWFLLISDYNLASGRVWVLFLSWIMVSPYIFFRFRNAA